MEFTGKVSGIATNWQTGQFTITFTCNEPNIVKNSYDSIKDLDKLDIRVIKHRKKRSLDANKYYWELLTKLAEVLKISKTMAHNLMLRKYGQREYLGGKIVMMPIPDTEEAERAALEAETYHIKPTSDVKEGRDGVMYRTYVMMRGSSSYNTKEMSELIDGLVSCAKEQGIETLPPDELERMKVERKP